MKRVDYSETGQLRNEQTSDAATRGPQFKKKKRFRKKLPKKAQDANSPKRLVRQKALPIQAIRRKPTEAERRVSDIIGKKQGMPRLASAVSGKRRELMFLGIGDEKILLCATALKNGLAVPRWALRFKGLLKERGGKLVFAEAGQLELPFALRDEKRRAVKRLYFDPREPSTIMPIAKRLYQKFANVTKGEVTRVLRSLETYQLNFGRRRPPTTGNRFFFKKPGMIAADLFFPSKHDGWEKYNCLSIMDCWSRFCWFYAIRTKKHEDVLICMNDFLQKFASLGHMPRRMLTDRGTDMSAATVAMEPYRIPKDGEAKLVMHPAAGQPVLVVEALNAQVQRRMAIFSTSGLVSSPATILHEIADQINNEPRQARGGMTPLQLLQLDLVQRKDINAKYRDRYVPDSEMHGLPDLSVGASVRLLKMTRKEQETNKLKGFSAKWTREIFRVVRKTKLRHNPFRYQYRITGRNTSFYRHELLKVTGLVDSVVPRLVRDKEVAVGLDWTPSAEDGADWSRS